MARAGANFLNPIDFDRFAGMSITAAIEANEQAIATEPGRARVVFRT